MVADITGDTENEHLLKRLAGHLKDAWLHMIADRPSASPYTPSQSAFIDMAAYIYSKAIIVGSRNGDSADDFESAYLVLQSAVEKALDVRDEAGNMLRDYKFNNAGSISILQECLMNGLKDAEDLLPSTNTGGNNAA